MIAGQGDKVSNEDIIAILAAYLKKNPGISAALTSNVKSLTVQGELSCCLQYVFTCLGIRMLVSAHMGAYIILLHRF